MTSERDSLCALRHGSPGGGEEGVICVRSMPDLVAPAILSCDVGRGVRLVSLGYGGAARLVLSDGESAIYAYACTNLNKRDNDPREDGEIYVELQSIAAAYVPKKTKRYPDGVPIRSAENVDYEKMIAAGSLKVTNCSNATCVGSDGVDAQTWELIHRIALRIQLDGGFPAEVGYFK